MKTYFDFFFNEETGETVCDYYVGDKKFTGKAFCHLEDNDFKSEITGKTISAQRAKIRYLKHELNNNLRPGLATLKQLYFSINRSKHYDKKDYVAKALNRQIKIKEEEISLIKSFITDQEGELRSYIEGKEELYQRIRKKRESNKKDEKES